MVTILDGSMGGELIRRGHSRRGGLWSAQPLLDAPHAVLELHREYVEAGAQLITTNTYSTVPSYLAKEGLEERFAELSAEAGRLAREAVHGSEARVAGSLPPLSESYRPDLVPDQEEAGPIYQALAEALEPFVDVFLCETMSSIGEALNAVGAATRLSRKPVYVSWTLSDEPGVGLRSGESIQDAVEALEDLDPAGYLVNCSRPESIEAALATLVRATTRPVGCYANRMENVPDGWTLDNEILIEYRDDLSAAAFAEWGRRTVEAGAEIVGGCCGIGPSDIAALCSALKSPAT